MRSTPVRDNPGGPVPGEHCRGLAAKRNSKWRAKESVDTEQISYLIDYKTIAWYAKAGSDSKSSKWGANRALGHPGGLESGGRGVNRGA